MNVVQMKEQLQKEEKEIIEKKNEVEIELSEVLPIIEQVKLEISQIQKDQINELKSMGSPPQKIVVVMKALLKLMEV